MGNEPITETSEFRIYINQKIIFFWKLIFLMFFEYEQN
jgi:hypothetical protein